ncbi:MAG: acetyl-CoA C-acyltransferase, partial [Pseudomonadota bacterium]|nr:acetyl-CoA C-acyltransferase [Pseudomonadota bacterium]
MIDAFICDAARTPIGKYVGSLAHVRTDDLATVPLKALIDRNSVDPAAIDEVFYGCANQAGEDNRDVARMAALLAGLPVSVPGVTLNRLCASGADAVGAAARAIKTGEAELTIAGGVESMTRAPLVMAKATSAFQRGAQIEDTVVGWRFVNPIMKSLYGAASMPETGENVADRYKVSREDQDRFGLWSQEKAAAAKAFHADEIVPVEAKDAKGKPFVFETDEYPRETSLELLAKLKPVVRADGTVTAGNASGINDGACAMFIASKDAAVAQGLTPRAKILGFASAGVEPDIMGVGPI